MITLDLSRCNSLEDLTAAVKIALLGKVVRIKESDIIDYFNSIGYVGVVQRNVICNRDVSFHSDSDNGEVVYKVLIYEYFVDPGSFDYVYSTFIIEL